MSCLSFFRSWILKPPSNARILFGGLDKSGGLPGGVVGIGSRIQGYLCHKAGQLDKCLTTSQRVVVYGVILLSLGLGAVLPLIDFVRIQSTGLVPKTLMIPPPLETGVRVAPDTLIQSFTLKPYTYENESY